MRLLFLFWLALFATFSSSVDAVTPPAEIPATELNIVRYWYSLSEKSPDLEAVVTQATEFQRANQFDKAQVKQALLNEANAEFHGNFNGSEVLVVNLREEIKDYDFDQKGFMFGVFDGNAYIPVRSPVLTLQRSRVRLDEIEYRIVFDNPQPFALLDMPTEQARMFLNGRNSQLVNVTIKMQPISAQTDEINTGYSSQTQRTLIVHVAEVSVSVEKNNQLVWQKSAGLMAADDIAQANQTSGEVVTVTQHNIETLWYRMQNIKPNFALIAAQSQKVKSANRFDKEQVFDVVMEEAEQQFDELIPNAKRFGGSIQSQLSEYDAINQGFHVSLFSGATYIEGGLFLDNAADFAFISMTPEQADTFLDTYGRYPNINVEFEAQPVLPQAKLTRLANLDSEKSILGYLTKVKLTASTGGQNQVLTDETREPLTPVQIQELARSPVTIDRAPHIEDADVVLTWAKAADIQPSFEAWVTNSQQYRMAANEFVQQRLYPVLLDERQQFYRQYKAAPFRVRIAARMGEYDFDNQQFEISRVDFTRILKYRDQIAADLFGDVADKDRQYELQLTNFADLQYFSASPKEAEELLTQMGSGRDITLDLLVYPALGIHNAAWGEKEVRQLQGLITDVRILGQSRWYFDTGRVMSRLFETTIAVPPSAVQSQVLVEKKPHLDPFNVDIKSMRLGMSKDAFETHALQTFGKVDPYRGNSNVLHFTNAGGESGYGYFDKANKLVFLQYYRTLPGRGKTEAVVASVKNKYGTPFKQDSQNIGSKIGYVYLYYSDPTEMGLDPKNSKVGLWVKIQESSQFKPITELEINLGTKP